MGVMNISYILKFKLWLRSDSSVPLPDVAKC